MTVWFTSDPHFGHKNIIKYCNRPFSSVEEMDEVMIERWNSKVRSKDSVFVVGDFTLEKGMFASSILEKLNGHKYFIPGSHDHKWWGEVDFANVVYMNKIETISKPFTSGTIVVLCHYAMRVWDRSHYGSIHLYGHSHGQTPVIQIPNSMDVGVDTNNFYPYSLDDILEKLEYGTKR